MDLNKYDLPKEQKPRFTDWKESVPVVLLSDALKIVGRKHGIRLLLDDDGVPMISLRPGLKAKDIRSDRWNVADQITELFLNATDDLRNLIATGKITIPN